MDRPANGAIGESNLIHQQQLKLGEACHYQLSPASVQICCLDQGFVWHTDCHAHKRPHSTTHRHTCMQSHPDTHTHTNTPRTVPRHTYTHTDTNVFQTKKSWTVDIWDSCQHYHTVRISAVKLSHRTYRIQNVSVSHSAKRQHAELWFTLESQRRKNKNSSAKEEDKNTWKTLLVRCSHWNLSSLHSSLSLSFFHISLNWCVWYKTDRGWLTDRVSHGATSRSS